VHHDAVGEENLGAGKIADAFLRAPHSGHGPGKHLIRRHARHGCLQIVDPLLVGAINSALPSVSSSRCIIAMGSVPEKWRRNG